ncbi:helix-turn-helix domain-containing protein [Epibacterium ulvae]|uniref:helix-turn-helix domain-containing protein n=1 Tax=Epibacterium ulvae TaxID=1156985 RepID=UPI0024908E4F|nr:helix-turn-helix transcriptional regulator [Epibacterium ulvae]
MTNETDPSDLLTDFGAYVKERRGEHGITQEALAKLSGVTVRSISDIETGSRRKSLKPATISDLLIALDGSTDREKFENFRNTLAQRRRAAAERAAPTPIHKDSSAPMWRKSWFRVAVSIIGAGTLAVVLWAVGLDDYDATSDTTLDNAQPVPTPPSRPIYPQDISAALAAGDVSTLKEMESHGVSVGDFSVALKTTSFSFFERVRDHEVALEWFKGLLHRGLDPETRVDHKRYGSVALLFSAFEAGSIQAAITLLENGASPHAFQDLPGIRRADLFFLFPAQAVSKAEHISELDKISLLGAMFEQGIAFYEPVEITYSDNPYQKGDSTWVLSKDELENLFKLTEQRPVAAELGCTFERSRSRCLEASRETGTNWCSIMDRIPAVIFVEDHSFRQNLVGINVQDLIAISGNSAYFFTTHLYGQQSVYGLLEATTDEDTFNLYHYGTPFFREHVCEGDDDIEMRSYCWRDFRVRKTSESTGLINGNYAAKLIPSCKQAE